MSFLESLRSKFDSRFGGQSTPEPSLSIQTPPSDFVDPYSGDQQQPSTFPEYSADDRPKNFPKCRPIIHHNIAVDLPRNHRRTVRLAYWHWYFHSFCYLWNFVAVAASLSLKMQGAIGGFFAALIAMLTAPVASFFIYFCLYTGVRRESPFYCYLWFAGFGMLLVSDVWMFIGFDAYGAAGIASMLEAFDEDHSHLVVGMLMFASMTLWLCDGCMAIYLIFLGRRTYKQLHTDFPPSDATRPLPAEEQPAPEVPQASEGSGGAGFGSSLRAALAPNFDRMKAALSEKISENKEAIASAVGRVVKDNREDIEKAVVSQVVNSQQNPPVDEAALRNKAALNSIFGS